MRPAPENFSAPPRDTSSAPAGTAVAVQKKKSIYQRVTNSMPLLVTIVVHLVLVGIAGAIVVQQNFGDKKKVFEAAAATEPVSRQVEHRLQVARRGGASGGATSPVSATRIQSTAQGALALPEMPDLPSTGTGGFGGFGGIGSGVGVGAGTGLATSLGGGTGLGGRGFMSLSFLGATTQNVSRVVFVVDTSSAIMEPRKGGFRAFGIIREEIMRLVGRLPPSALFNVVLFQGVGGADHGVEVNLYEKDLVTATSDNKKDFFSWMTPVNAKFGEYGPSSATRRNAWRPRPLPPEAGVDSTLLPPVWSRAVQAALEQKPDVVYVITSQSGRAYRKADEKTLAERKARAEREMEKFERDMKSQGLDPAAVRAAQRRAHEKAWKEFEAANRKLVEAGKDPIVTSRDRLFSADVQAALRKHGIKIELDKKGWSTASGTPIHVPGGSVSSTEEAQWADFVVHYARVQRHLVPERPALNVFLFVGPNDQAEEGSRNLTLLTKRNGGSFQLLTTKRLEELKAQEETGKPAGA